MKKRLERGKIIMETSTREACFRITEVRQAVFSIRQVSQDERPGRVDSITHIIKITNIPAGVEARAITDLLSRYTNLVEPPERLSWAELNG